MLVVYGWKTKLKEEKKLGNKHCTNCKHDEEMSMAKEIFIFNLFGIPVFKKVKRRFVMCRNCGILEELTKTEYNEKLKEI